VRQSVPQLPHLLLPAHRILGVCTRKGFLGIPKFDLWHQVQVENPLLASFMRSPQTFYRLLIPGILQRRQSFRRFQSYVFPKP
jgi:hypothetical protein